jgi:uncharacterized protein YijF (DUF1287 family)
MVNNLSYHVDLVLQNGDVYRTLGMCHDLVLEPVEEKENELRFAIEFNVVLIYSRYSQG